MFAICKNFYFQRRTFHLLITCWYASSSCRRASLSLGFRVASFYILLLGRKSGCTYLSTTLSCSTRVIKTRK